MVTYTWWLVGVLVLGAGLHACSAFISAIPQVSLLFTTEKRNVWYDQKQRSDFLAPSQPQINPLSLNSHQIGLCHEFLHFCFFRARAKPCLCHFLGWVRQCYLCKSSFLLPLARTLSLQTTIWWVCSNHHLLSFPSPGHHTFLHFFLNLQSSIATKKSAYGHLFAPEQG